MNNGEDNHVWVSIGITKNLGNYESMRLDAGAKMAGDPQDDKLWNKLWETSGGSDPRIPFGTSGA